MNTAKIRRATARDSERLSQLAKLSKASWGYPIDWLRLWNDELALSPEYVASNHVLAAEINREIVGVCVLEDRGDSWAIEHVWVDPRIQGKGVGRALVVEALANAKSKRRGTVRVVSDPFAEAFYLRLGARKVQEIAAPMPGSPERVLPLLEFIV